MKRHLVLTALAALLPIIGCAVASEDGDGESSEDAITQATFDIDLAKNHSRKVVEHGKGDFCAALKRLPGGAYDDDDTKKEDKLCAADFYADADQGEEKAVALCPKLNSTNPGTNIYELPEGQTKSAIQNSSMCANTKELDKLDKLGKYKQTMWCSHTGAVLAAYHVSRALGDVAGVPVAVLRTMDKASHREVVDMGAKLTAAKFSNPNTTIRRNWNALWPCLHDGRSDCGATEATKGLFIQGLGFLWDDDVKASGFKGGHLIGALMGNASEDGNYPGISTAASLKGNKRYMATTTAGLSFPKTFDQETVQGILAMKDIGDFLILDSIIEQQDRFSESGGNLSQKKYLLWEQDGAMHSERADKKKDAPATALTVARMVIEDNDCGLRKGMRNVRGYDELVAPIRHLAPSTYTGLQELAKNIDGQREVFTQGMAMNEREFARLAENVKFVASGFAAKCASGKLELDLDVEAYIKGEIPTCK
jgi:hypothetical protein